MTRLRAFDSRGRLVGIIVEEELAAGEHSFTWKGLDRNGRVLPSGVYFFTFDAGDARISRKMSILN